MTKRNFFWLTVFVTAFTTFAQAGFSEPAPADFDVIIKDGTVYDGTGAEPKQVDVAIRGDRIVGIGDFKTANAKTIIDAKGLAVAPGFINMLSWSVASLIQDGRSQSEIRQGNGSRRTRDRHFVNLSARVLCEDRRTNRAVQGCREISGQIHLAHAQRGEPSA